MEHVWQSLQQEEGAEAREAANGPQDRRVDGLSNGTHPAVPPREKCWIHRVRRCRLLARHHRTVARSRTSPVCCQGPRKLSRLQTPHLPRDLRDVRLSALYGPPDGRTLGHRSPCRRLLFT